MRIVKLNYEFVYRKMLPQDLKSIEAGNPKKGEQYYQPYIDQIIIKHLCCYSSENEIYQSTFDQKFICEECYRFKLPFLNQKYLYLSLTAIL